MDTRNGWYGQFWPKSVCFGLDSCLCSGFQHQFPTNKPSFPIQHQHTSVPNPIENHPHHKGSSFHPYQPSKVKPCTNRETTLDLFPKADQQVSNSTSEPTAKWRSAVTCGWLDEKTAINIIVEDIAKVFSPSTSPTLISFGTQRAILFTSSPKEASQIAAMGSIQTRRIIVVLSRWHELVNSFDVLKAKYKGWICIRGLPFHLWNEDTFSRIGSYCKGLVEIDKQTKDFSVLKKLRSESRIHAFRNPPSFHQLIDWYWVTLQLIPQFNVSSDQIATGDQCQQAKH